MCTEKVRNNETAIIRKLAKELISHNLSITVFDGEEKVLSLSTDVNAIMKEMFACDEEAFMVYNSNKKCIGTIYFIYDNGEEGTGVIVDNSVALEKYMEETTAYVDKLQDQL